MALKRRFSLVLVHFDSMHGKTTNMGNAPSDDTDQPGHRQRQIRVFATGTTRTLIPVWSFYFWSVKYNHILGSTRETLTLLHVKKQERIPDCACAHSDQRLHSLEQIIAKLATCSVINLDSLCS